MADVEEKVCKYCGKTFTKNDIYADVDNASINAYWKNRVYCSDECRKDATKIIMKRTQKNGKNIKISLEVADMISNIGLKTDSYSSVIKKLIAYYNSSGKEKVKLWRDEKKFLGSQFCFKTVNEEEVIAGWKTVKPNSEIIFDGDTGKHYKIVNGKRIEVSVV